MPIRKLQHHLLSPATSRLPWSIPGSPPGASQPAFFDTLQELDEWWTAADRPDAGSAPKIAPALSEPPDRPRLVACHDFKGGYADDPFVRGYSLEWFANIDTFVYFAHKRVSIPPDPWISAARTHGTKVLGTFIVEWAESWPDARRLVLGPSSPSPRAKAYVNPFALPGSQFPMINTHYADALIDLAIVRGVDGWLMNVECDLCEGSGENPVRGAEWARAIRIWVEYLRREGERRIGPHWQVFWYDSVMHSTGMLRWQSRLDPIQTLPFLTAASSVFLDYHWRPLFNYLSSMSFSLASRYYKTPTTPPPLHSADGPGSLGDMGVAWRSKQIPRRRTDVYVGVDLYGRGCPWGGGFAGSTAAACAIKGPRPALSVAMFAQGWTWECHHLHPARRGREGEQSWWAGWWEDDRYLWTGLPGSTEELADRTKLGYAVAYSEPIPLCREPSTGNARVDARRIEEEEQRTRQPPGTEPSELPRHVPWAALFPAHAPPDAPCGGGVGFETTFSLGSGRAFWVDGEQVLVQGWTDMGQCSPKPDLAMRGAAGWRVVASSGDQASAEWSGWQGTCDVREDVGWFGSGSVALTMLRAQPPTHRSEGAIVVPLHTVNVRLSRAGKLNAVLVWRRERAVDGVAGVGLSFDLRPELGAARSLTGAPAAVCNHRSGASSVLVGGPCIGELQVVETTCTELPHGWRRSEYTLAFKAAPPVGTPRDSIAPLDEITVHRLGIVLPDPAISITIGALSLARAAGNPAAAPAPSWTRLPAPPDAAAGSVWGRLNFTAPSPSSTSLIYGRTAAPGADGQTQDQKVFLGAARTGRCGRDFVIAGLDGGCLGFEVRDWYVSGEGAAVFLSA